MRTTLAIPDPIYRRLKQRAALTRRTLSSLVAELLDAGLRGTAEAPTLSALQPLPVYSMGAAGVDVADREALQRAMDSLASD